MINFVTQKSKLDSIRLLILVHSVEYSKIGRHLKYVNFNESLVQLWKYPKNTTRRSDMNCELTYSSLKVASLTTDNVSMFRSRWKFGFPSSFFEFSAYATTVGQLVSLSSVSIRLPRSDNLRPVGMVQPWTSGLAWPTSNTIGRYTWSVRNISVYVVHMSIRVDMGHCHVYNREVKRFDICFQRFAIAQNVGEAKFRVNLDFPRDVHQMRTRICFLSASITERVFQE
jgi:hypothetical protein